MAHSCHSGNNRHRDIVGCLFNTGHFLPFRVVLCHPLGGIVTSTSAFPSVTHSYKSYKMLSGSDCTISPNDASSHLSNFGDIVSLVHPCRLLTSRYTIRQFELQSVYVLWSCDSTSLVHAFPVLYCGLTCLAYTSTHALRSHH